MNCIKRGLQLYTNTYIVLQRKSDSQLCRADPINAGPWKVQMFDGCSVSGPRDAQPIPTAQPFGVQPLRPQQHPRLPPAPPAGFAVPADVAPVGVFWLEQCLLTRAEAQHRNLSALPAVAGGAERCHMQVAKHTQNTAAGKELLEKHQRERRN